MLRVRVLATFYWTFRGPMYDRRHGTFNEEVPPAPGRRVDATVKWFNPSKGFGFVTMADGTQDAFLPMAILRRAGYDDVSEGSSISCEIGSGVKGPLVVNVISIDASTAVTPRPPVRGHEQDRLQPPAHRPCDIGGPLGATHRPPGGPFAYQRAAPRRQSDRNIGTDARGA